MFKVERKYLGKWVVVKSRKIVESSKTFDGLTKKIEARKDRRYLRFALIPVGPLNGGFRCS